jgi:hypothetical protein
MRQVVFDTLPVPYSEPSSVLGGYSRRLPWLLRSLIAGAAGAALIRPRTALALGLAHGWLRRRTCEPRASLMLMAVSGEPVAALLVGATHNAVRRVQTGMWTARLFDAVPRTHVVPSVAEYPAQASVTAR